MKYGEYFEHLLDKFVGSHVCQINGVGKGVVGGGDCIGKSSFLLLKSKTINKTQNIIKSKHDNK